MKKLWCLLMMFISCEVVSQDSLVFDYHKRYKYFEGDQNFEFYIYKKDARIYSLLELIPEKQKSYTLKAGNIKFDSVYVLSRIPVLVHQGCRDEKCKEIKVRVVIIGDSTEIEMYRNGYMRLIVDGGVPKTMIPIGGRQILFCPQHIAMRFIEKIERGRVKKVL